MKRRSLKQCGAVLLSATLLMSSVPVAMAGDTWPWPGDMATAPNQPHVVGQRVYDLEFWGEDTEEGADLLTAKIPIQQRNEAFSATQANPDLKTDAEIFNMQGDYGNSFFEATPYNNTFSQYLFNYWQYTDYYASWHGVTTKGAPMSQYQPDGAWQQRYFEFGLINMPNPAYTNAAHKNGAKSIGCIFLPRAGQTHASMIAKDENGEFPIGKKLIEFANYYGFDGYFINQEESIPSADVPVYKEFTKYLIDNGMWIQWYDSITPSGGLSYQNQLNASNSTFILDDAYDLGKVNSSLFVNYDWFYSNRVNTSLAHAEQRGINPFTEVFFGVECNQGKLSGSHGSAREISQIYAPDSKNLRASVALFTPSDWIQMGLDGDLYGTDNTNKRADAGYQWMIAERERMFYSGVAQDPTKTGKMSGYENPDIGVSNASGWVGVADFAVERSVVNGTNFYTNFNTGHGVEYYQNGQVINSNEWSNMNIQDILPSWQWWIDTEGTKLNVDFDYGEKFKKNNKAGEELDTGYQKVGGYNGGSSLVVNGKLDAENFLHLYKTDMQVNENSKVSITYNKVSATDNSSMKVGVIFEDYPERVVTFEVPKANQQTEGWVTKSIDLSAYEGSDIAAIGLYFKNGKTEIENYQMNIGEIKVTDGSVQKPAAPTGFTISKAYDTDEMIVNWDIADYNDVKQYNLYANLSDGSRVFLGGTYDDTYYIKSLYNEQSVVSLELKAVAEDGTESEAATATYQYSDKVSNIVVDETTTANGNKLQNTNVGYMDISWTNPATEDYQGVEITVTPAKYWDYKERNEVYTKTVEKGVDSTRIMTPIADGSSYTLSMRVINNDGTKGEPILYTGHFKDVYIEPFDEGYTVNGSKITFNIPKSEDWWHMYAYVNGQPLTFRSEYDSDKQFAIRGKSFIHNVSLPSTSGVVEVILEDYSGNRSKPVYLPYGQGGGQSEAVDETMFPDPVLLAAVKEQIGDTVEALNSFTGTLDLSNLDIQDYTGLDKISAAEINLTGSNLTSIQQGTFGPNVDKVTLADSKDLLYIYPGTFTGTNVKEIDITGCTKLQVVGFNDSNLEKIVCEDAADMTDMISVNLSGSKFDLSAGTPEKAFADAMAVVTEGKSDIVLTDPEESNLALNAQVVAGQTNINASTAAKLFDGKYTDWDYLSYQLPLDVVVDLGSEQTITSSIVRNDGESYGLAAFEIWASKDGQDYDLVASVTGNKQETVTVAFENPMTARYFKLHGTERMGYGNYMREWELCGHNQIVYAAGVDTSNQRPNLYPAEMAEIVRLQKKPGVTIDMQTYLDDCINNAVTVRGTTLADLTGADFIDPDYDMAGSIDVPEIDLIKVTDAEGNVNLNTIDLSKDGVYTVEYITYHDAALNGKAVYTQTVYVRAVTSILEEIIAEAEILIENGALDNTMEAVVNEFNAALEAAKDIAAKDGATQQEVNDATLRLLAAIAKVDWKQGDKTILEIAVEVATSIEGSLDLYVEAGKQEFKDALAEARELLASGNAWQDDINDSVARLTDAMKALRMAPNKDILNDMIANAKAMDLSAYTADTANAVRAALAAAEAVAADANADQKAVDAAANTLEAALKGLAFVSSNTPADNNAVSGGSNSTTNVGEGTTPSKTGDSFGAAGFAGLAVLSAAGVIFALKSRKKD